jgi:polysaccharide pyruvyl transferase WcaK-like protein
MYFALDRAHEGGVYEKNVRYLCDIFDAPKRKTVDYLNRRVKVFFTVDGWVDFYRHIDFALGTRIHGTIASLLAGTPALLITHDTRITELARAMNIPYISQERFCGSGVNQH